MCVCVCVCVCIYKLVVSRAPCQARHAAAGRVANGTLLPIARARSTSPLASRAKSETGKRRTSPARPWRTEAPPAGQPAPLKKTKAP